MSSGNSMWQAIAAIGAVMAGIAAVVGIALNREQRVVIVPPAEASASLPAATTAPTPKAELFHYVTNLDPDGDNWLALKRAPDLASERMLQMEPNTLLTVLEDRDIWLKVRLQSGEVGWTFSKYVACCRTTDGPAVN